MTTNAVGPPERERPALEQRFWAKVDTSAGLWECWPWTGETGSKGYGRFQASRRHGVRQRLGAHRFAYELSTGEHPGVLQIDHTCHNRLCCNPSHLRPATNKQNSENLRGAHRNSKTGVRGAYWDKRDRRFRARVKHHGKAIHVGLFDTIEEADAAVRAKRLELFTHNDRDRLAS